MTDDNNNACASNPIESRADISAVSSDGPLASYAETLAKAASRATGRKAALAVIDSIMGDALNLQKFREALQETFNASPVKFYMELVKPLLPSSINLGDKSDSGIHINIVTVDKTETTKEVISAEVTS